MTICSKNCVTLIGHRTTRILQRKDISAKTTRLYSFLFRAYYFYPSTSPNHSTVPAAFLIATGATRHRVSVGPPRTHSEQIDFINGVPFCVGNGKGFPRPLLRPILNALSPPLAPQPTPFIKVRQTGFLPLSVTNAVLSALARLAGACRVHRETLRRDKGTLPRMHRARRFIRPEALSRP